MTSSADPRRPAAGPGPRRRVAGARRRPAADAPRRTLVLDDPSRPSTDDATWTTGRRCPTATRPASTPWPPRRGRRPDRRRARVPTRCGRPLGLRHRGGPGPRGPRRLARLRAATDGLRHRPHRRRRLGPHDPGEPAQLQRLHLRQARRRGDPAADLPVQGPVHQGRGHRHQADGRQERGDRPGQGLRRRVMDVSGDGGEGTSVRVMAFVNQATTTKAQQAPAIDQNRVIATMRKVGTAGSSAICPPSDRGKRGEGPGRPRGRPGPSDRWRSGRDRRPDHGASAAAYCTL